MIVILDNLRSCHNVGSILRSADGFGIEEVWFVGSTPYPRLPEDNRIPHLITKQTAKIQKTALGAEKLPGRHFQNVKDALLEAASYRLVALEQTETALDIYSFKFSFNDAIIVGAELEGVSKEFLDKANIHIAIPMLGNKESFNVSVATAIALYAANSSIA